jgi:hypothetical protein
MPTPRVIPPKPAIKVRADPIIARLPQMTPADTRESWLHALGILNDDGRDGEAHNEAERVVRAIEDVWKRRSSGQLPDGWFRWPDTHARGGNGSLRSEDWLAEGPLKFLGYSGGEDAPPPEVRRGILGRVFEGPLPPVFPPEYLDEWSDPGSPARLKKMADSIANFARLKKQHDAARFAKAIRDWENDLRHLYDTYYVGRFGFSWPRTSIFH